MATAATVPTRPPATEQARKPGGTRSPAPFRPPAPLKASQQPIIRLAASLGDSLSSDNGKPSRASRRKRPPTEAAFHINTITSPIPTRVISPQRLRRDKHWP